MTGRILSGVDLQGDQHVRTQVVIVGSGAGGATTARILSEAGIDVLILEEGSRHPTQGFHGDICGLMGDLYRGGGLTPIMGKPNIAYAEGCCLGGSTVINGALFWRTPQAVLEEWEQLSGLPLLGDDDMSPLFEKLEADLHVTTQPDRASNKASWLLVDGSEKLGWQAEAAPRAQKHCQNSNRCPTGCPTKTKQSMSVSYLPQAMENGARIFCDARVDDIIMKGNRACGVNARVQYGKSTHRLKVEADDVFICGGPMQTPYLLQGNGIKNHVGDNLQIHINLKVVATFDDDIDSANGTIMTAQVKEFANRGLYIGGSNFDPVYLALTLATHGVETVESVMNDWRRTGIYVAQLKASGLGKVRNFPLIDRPMPYYSLNDIDMANIRFAILRTAELLLSSGARIIYLPIAGIKPVRTMDDARKIADSQINPTALDLLSVHGMASCPMGSKEDQSALDPFGRVWSINNLYVNDASMLPGATGANPQMTIMAMAMRNAQAFLEGRKP